jgi:hypothetical protein
MTKPHLPLDLQDLPPPPSKDLLAFLPVLGQSLHAPPEVFFDDEPLGAPRTPPRASGFVTVVEWPLRPGDTRIEAYFVGSDQNRKNWFLWQFTMNDLVVITRKYLERRPVAKIPRQNLSKRDAAAVLLKATWEYERDQWQTPAFMMVSACGCLDSTAAYAIAELVWGERYDDQ